MAYATLADVQDRLPNLELGDPVYYPTLKPTETQVETWLDDVSGNVIDPVVRTLVSAMPVTDTYGLAFLETMAVNYVCAEILRSLDRDQAAIAEYQEAFDAAMKLIRERPTILEAPAGGASPSHHSARSAAPFTRHGDSASAEDRLW